MHEDFFLNDTQLKQQASKSTYGTMLKIVINGVSAEPYSEFEAMQPVFSNELMRKGGSSVTWDESSPIVDCKLMNFAQAFACFPCGRCSVGPCAQCTFGCACKQACFGACGLVFASICIGLFACVHKRPLYWSMALFTKRAHKHTPVLYSCCCMTPDQLFPDTAMEPIRLHLSVYRLWPRAIWAYGFMSLLLCTVSQSCAALIFKPLNPKQTSDIQTSGTVRWLTDTSLYEWVWAFFGFWAVKGFRWTAAPVKRDSA